MTKTMVLSFLLKVFIVNLSQTGLKRGLLVVLIYADYGAWGAFLYTIKHINQAKSARICLKVFLKCLKKVPFATYNAGEPLLQMQAQHTLCFYTVALI